MLKRACGSGTSHTDSRNFLLKTGQEVTEEVIVEVRRLLQNYKDYKIREIAADDGGAGRGGGHRRSEDQCESKVVVAKVKMWPSAALCFTPEFVVRGADVVVERLHVVTIAVEVLVGGGVLQHAGDGAQQVALFGLQGRAGRAVHHAEAVGRHHGRVHVAVVDQVPHNLRHITTVTTFPSMTQDSAAATAESRALAPSNS